MQNRCPRPFAATQFIESQLAVAKGSAECTSKHGRHQNVGRVLFLCRLRLLSYLSDRGSDALVFVPVSLMPTIKLTTEIAAPIEVVFDLARSIDLHEQSTSQTNEKAVAGRTSGLIELGESVTWEATHFFVRQRLTARIVKFEPPTHFRDSMVSGAFLRFDHDHFFERCDNGTVMTDVFDFTSPLGPLGQIANWLFLTRYLRKLLCVRDQLIKSVAESGDVERFINPSEAISSRP